NDIENRITKETVRGGGKPRQSFDVSVEYKNPHGFTGALYGYYDRWNEPADAFPNDRKMLIDMKLSQEIKNLTLFLNIYNLANSTYWADYYFPMPERYFEGGFTVHW
ncbi:MAG: TonB-dependent receptor, partial [Candidatus Omnitrophica bacterium]|nr:TonB-dependent receptor [Candidatus Omnitrophota bacterium]